MAEGSAKSNRFFDTTNNLIYNRDISASTGYTVDFNDVGYSKPSGYHGILCGFMQGFSAFIFSTLKIEPKTQTEAHSDLYTFRNISTSSYTAQANTRKPNNLFITHISSILVDDQRSVS